MSNPFRLSALPRAFTRACVAPGIPMAESHDKFPLSYGSHRPRALDDVLRSYESYLELPMMDCIPLNTEPQSTANSLFYSDLEASGMKPRHWLDRMREYTIRTRDRTFSPVEETSSLGCVTGVGSQFDRSATPASREDVQEPDSQGPPLSTAPDVLSHEQVHQKSSSWTTSFKRKSAAAISQDTSILSESDYSMRRFSNDTALRSASVVESISTRPSSIVSTATSGDFTGRVGIYARGGSPWKRNVSSSSVLSTSRASPGPRPEVDLDEHPVPPIPSAVTAWPSRSVDYWVDGLAYSVSDQVTAAGRMAQRRRANRSRLSEMFEEEPPDSFESIEDPGRLRPGICVENSLEPARESILSIIEEGNSDTGCSTSEAVPMQHRASGEHVDSGFLSISRHASTRETRSCFGTDNMTEPTSGEARSLTLTPGTSIAGHTDLDDLEAHEMSEDDESISNFTDETDESFYEAFVATSLDPGLLSAAIALKDHIASLVLAKVTDWARSYSPGQETRGTLHNSASGADLGGGKANDTTGRDDGGKKRGFDERNPGGSDRGNGDDQDKRRKTEAAPTKEGVAKMEANLACPFLKGHPDRKWPRCQKGWPSVHRIKEHVYKAHQLPIRCDRCFKQFNKEAELKHHHREDERCEVVDPPQDVLGIDEETRRNLRSRAAARNGTQEEKWRHMYRIIFPDVKDSDIPSPHYDLQALELPISAETRAQYRRFLRQEIPPRLVRKITRNLNEMPEVRDNLHFSERKVAELVFQAVWNAFDHVLPSLLPQSAPLETPHDSMPELASRRDTQCLPTNSFPPQATEFVNVSATWKMSQASLGVLETTHFPHPSYSDSNGQFNGAPSQPDGLVSGPNALWDSSGSQPPFQTIAARSTSPIDESILTKGQSIGHASPPPQTEALDELLDFTWTY
ncbi:hypothetical protein QQX98_000028 [Neonectria punicea]|uniref:C2H2-type domain-containing protein n=1 Tax=Neonectria punicea TaxID=979145 RepID=A0ABR1HVX6_9HYPO